MTPTKTIIQTKNPIEIAAMKELATRCAESDKPGAMIKAMKILPIPTVIKAVTTNPHANAEALDVAWSLVENDPNKLFKLMVSQKIHDHPNVSKPTKNNAFILFQLTSADIRRAGNQTAAVKEKGKGGLFAVPSWMLLRKNHTTPTGMPAGD